jgi:hypothetical protein
MTTSSDDLSDSYEELEDDCIRNETEIDQGAIYFDVRTLLRVHLLIPKFLVNSSS